MAKITDTSGSRFAELDALDVESVVLHDSLLKRRRDVNSSQSLPRQYEECERTGRIDNFRIASGGKSGKVSPHLAADSDLFKWVEAAALDTAGCPGSELGEKLIEIIGLIAAAQEGSGYLNTSFLFEKKNTRWADLHSAHELYCGGHLIQAAVAHKRSTGKHTLMDVAVKWADHVCGRFGPGRTQGTGGHPEIEMALVELFRETADRKYLDSARYFLDQRGTAASGLHGQTRFQDHLPIRKQTGMAGHAVRQLYLLCGVADVYAETGEAALLAALEAQWADFTRKKMALTGGAGARYQHEAFGNEYEIPSRTGYYETCASIASFMWNWRMLQIAGEACYADEMERALYNGILSGVSLDGSKYFYTNPLEHDGKEDLAERHRGSNERTARHWDFTACCPPNVSRLLAALPGYLYGKKEDALYVHLYCAGSARLVMGGVDVTVTQATKYPWDGAVNITVQPEKTVEFSLLLRIPAWAEDPAVRVNDRLLADPPSVKGYVQISRKWAAGDRVEVVLGMPIRCVLANARVSNACGSAALMRGPVVYCVEDVDCEGVGVYQVRMPAADTLGWEYEPDLLDGIVTIRGMADTIAPRDELYFNRPAGPQAGGNTRFKAIPYYTWANRAPGAMKVWLALEDETFGSPSKTETRRAFTA